MSRVRSSPDGFACLAPPQMAFVARTVKRQSWRALRLGSFTHRTYPGIFLFNFQTTRGRFHFGPSWPEV